MLPACAAVGIDEGSHRFRGIKRRRFIAIAVEGDAVQRKLGAFGSKTAGLKDLLGDFDHAGGGCGRRTTGRLCTYDCFCIELGAGIVLVDYDIGAISIDQSSLSYM